MTMKDHVLQALPTAREALDRAFDNMALWHEEMALREELSALQAQDLARFLAQKHPDPDDWHGEEMRIGEQQLSDSPAVRATQLFERVTFCRELFKEKDRKQPSHESKIAPLPEMARVAMLSGPAFGDALMAFELILPSADPLFCRSFTDIFEEVTAGHADFGILPIEDSTQGKLFRIYEQCERFELHIATTTDVKEDDDKNVRMALLYKNKPPVISIPEGERILECLLFGGEHALSELLAAATAFCLTIRRIDSLPLSYREDGFVQSIVLRGDQGEIGAFLFYLTLFMPHTTVTADYINIKTRDKI